MPPDYDKHDPEQKQIYRFVRTLFSAAQLTAECAIVTLVSVWRMTSALWQTQFCSQKLCLYDLIDLGTAREFFLTMETEEIS